MAIPALLGGAARAVGGQMAKSGGKAMAKKVMNRGDKKQNKSVSGESTQQDGGKSGALVIRPKTTLIPASVLKVPDTKTTSVGSDGILVTIYKRVVEIDKILKGTLAEEKALTKEKTKQDKKEDRDKKEGKLEKKKTKEEKKQKGLPLPGLSFFDRIKKFITTIIGGFILQKLVDFAPQLGEIIKVINSGLDTTADLIVGVIDGLGTFLKWGQDAIDGSKDWLKNNRGGEAVGRFNELLGSLGNLLNATIIVGSLAARLGAKPGAKPGTKPGIKPTNPLVRKPGRLDPRGNARNIQRKHGTAARGLYEQAYEKGIKNGKSPLAAAKSAKASVEKAIKYKKIVSRPQTGSLGGTDKGSSIRKGGAQKIGKRVGLKLFGKQGVKLVSKTFGKIPVMGPLIVAVASLLAGEPMGQAVFKGIGAALGGLLGSFIPIPVIGTILGETIGVLVGDMMYSLLFEGKEGVANAGKKFMTALKTALDIGGLIVNFFKEGFGRFFKDFPTFEIPSGFGRQKAMGMLFPFLDKDGDGLVGKMPDLSILFDPLKIITKLIPHAAASFLPAIFGSGGTAYGDSKAPDNKTEKSTDSGGDSSGTEPHVGEPKSVSQTGNASGETGKRGNAIYLHWTAGNYNSTAGPYHTVFTGDGTMHRKTEYTQRSGHTEGRNTNSVGLSLAANPDINQWPTEDQKVAMAKEGARIAKNWGWSAGDINLNKVLTHGEAGSNLDGVNATTNYGLFGRGDSRVQPEKEKLARGSIADFERWDLDIMKKGDKYGSGGDEMRNRIKGFMQYGGETKGMGKYVLGEKGKEFVLDNDSYTSIKMKYPGFLAALNAADGAGALKVLEAYASYEQGGESTVVINQNQIPVSMMQQKQSPSAPIVIPVGGEDPFASTYANC